MLVFGGVAMCELQVEEQIEAVGMLHHQMLERVGRGAGKVKIWSVGQIVDVWGC